MPHAQLRNILSGNPAIKQKNYKRISRNFLNINKDLSQILTSKKEKEQKTAKKSVKAKVMDFRQMTKKTNAAKKRVIFRNHSSGPSLGHKSSRVFSMDFNDASKPLIISKLPEKYLNSQRPPSQQKTMSVHNILAKNQHSQFTNIVKRHFRIPMKAEHNPPQPQRKDKGTTINKDFIFEHLEGSSLYEEDDKHTTLRNMEVKQQVQPNQATEGEFEIKEGLNLSISGPSSLTESNRHNRDSHLEGNDLVKLNFTSAQHVSLSPYEVSNTRMPVNQYEAIAEKSRQAGLQQNVRQKIPLRPSRKRTTHDNSSMECENHLVDNKFQFSQKTIRMNTATHGSRISEPKQSDKVSSQRVRIDLNFTII